MRRIYPIIVYSVIVHRLTIEEESEAAAEVVALRRVEEDEGTNWIPRTVVRKAQVNWKGE